MSSTGSSFGVVGHGLAVNASVSPVVNANVSPAVNASASLSGIVTSSSEEIASVLHQAICLPVPVEATGSVAGGVGCSPEERLGLLYPCLQSSFAYAVGCPSEHRSRVCHFPQHHWE